MLSKDGIAGRKLIKIRKKPALANTNAVGLQEIEELAGLSPLFILVF